jgi:hypothetical protein
MEVAMKYTNAIAAAYLSVAAVGWVVLFFMKVIG